MLHTRRRSARFALALTVLLATLAGCGREGKIEDREAAALEARIERVASGLAQRHPMVGEAPATIAERMEFFGVPGVAVAVIQDFEVQWSRGYGTAGSDGEARPMTADTPMQAGSISPSVAATIALQLVDAGELSLDAPVGELLTGWTLPDNGLTAEQPVTLRRLLSHAAGLPGSIATGYPPASPLPTLAQVASGEVPARTAPIEVVLPPGTQAIFSAGGYVLVQQIVEEHAGRPFAEVARERLLSPLGMADSTFEQPPPAAFLERSAVGHRVDGSALGEGYRLYPEQAAGGLWTTAADLARFSAALQRSIQGRDATLLSQTSAQALATDQLGQTGFGFDITIHGKSVYLRQVGFAAGFQGLIVLHRDSGYGAVVLANSNNAGRLAEEIVRAVAREYAWDSYLNPEVEWTPLAARQLEAYVGRYQVAPDRVLRVELAGDHLMAYDSAMALPDPLFPVGDHRFYRQFLNAMIDFELGEDGRARSYSFDGPNETRIQRDRLPEGELLPVELLLGGRIEEAIAAYRQQQIASPQRLNALGYQLIGAMNQEAARALFELNSELFPESPNVWDSLGEVYLRSGDLERAGTAYRRALAQLETAEQMAPPLRRFLAGNIRRNLAIVESGGEL
jgi:CubicO group peptidase (beta-lactamase class C family)